MRTPVGLFLYDEAKKLAHKIPTLEEYDASSGKGIPILVDYMDKPTSIGVELRLLDNLTAPISIRRLYVAKSHVAEANRIVRNLLNEEE